MKAETVTCDSCGHPLSKEREDGTIRIQIPTKAVFVKKSGEVEIRCPLCKADIGLPLKLDKRYLTP